MTIQEVISGEKAINVIELGPDKSTAGFEEYYAEDVIMIEADGTTFEGKEACRKMEVEFNAGIVSIAEKRIISSVVSESIDPAYEFMVTATWYYDMVTQMYPIKGIQTSYAFWADSKVKKVIFKFPSEVIA